MMENYPFKVCFKCNIEKPLSDFYKHKQMADGHLNKCIKCNLLDANKHREDNLERIREYDRNREYRFNPETVRKYREKNPLRRKAHNIVNSAIRSGKLIKGSCEICGTTERINGHHDDYAFPLKVRWLCSMHHHEWHRIHGEAITSILQ